MSRGLRSVERWIARWPSIFFTIGTVILATTLPTVWVAGFRAAFGRATGLDGFDLLVAAIGLAVGGGVLLIQRHAERLQGISIIIGLQLPGQTTFQVQAARDREAARKPRPLLVFEHVESLPAAPQEWQAPLTALGRVLSGYVGAARANHRNVRVVRLYLQTPLAAAFTAGRLLRFNTYADIIVESSDPGADPPSTRTDVHIGHPVRRFGRDFVEARIDQERINAAPPRPTATMTIDERRDRQPAARDRGTVWVSEQLADPDTVAASAPRVAYLGAGVPAWQRLEQVTKYASDIGAAAVLAIEYVDDIPDTAEDVESAIATMIHTLDQWTARAPHDATHLIFGVPASIAAATGALLPKRPYQPVQYSAGQYVPVWTPSD